MKLLREKLYLCEDEEENDLASTIEIKDDEIEDTQEEQSQEVELDNQDVQEISDEESSLDMPVNDELQTIGASSMITDLITQSWEKVNTFNSIIASLVDMQTSQDVIDIVKDVENDLFISIGQLQKALELISGQTVEVTKDNLSDETIKDEEEVKVEDEVSINDTEDSEEVSKEEKEEDEKKEESLNESLDFDSLKNDFKFALDNGYLPLPNSKNEHDKTCGVYIEDDCITYNACDGASIKICRDSNIEENGITFNDIKQFLNFVKQMSSKVSK